jgi:hypothetical protein
MAIIGLAKSAEIVHRGDKRIMHSTYIYSIQSLYELDLTAGTDFSFNKMSVQTILIVNCNVNKFLFKLMPLISSTFYFFIKK